MDRFKITLTNEAGETIVLICDTRDLYLWEKTYKDAAAGQLNDPATIQITKLYQLGHVAARVRGQFHGSLDELVDQYAVEMEPVAPADPTPADHEPEN